MSNAMTAIVEVLTSASLYKPSQGRLARQLTGGVIARVGLYTAWTLSQQYSGGPVAKLAPAVLAGLIAWVAFRIVNWAPFAEFLIAVESEMAKVSWPSKDELVRSTTVVLGSMFLLTLVLLVFDWFWLQVLNLVGFLRTS